MLYAALLFRYRRTKEVKEFLLYDNVHMNRLRKVRKVYTHVRAYMRILCVCVERCCCSY